MKCAVWMVIICGLLYANAYETPQALFERAAQALSAGDYGAAEGGFQAVLKQEPNNVGAIGNLGIVYARTNRNDKAISLYKRALRLSPDDEAILLNLGIAYLKQEQHELARPYFERVVKLDPKHRQARQLLAVCRLYTGGAGAAIEDLEALRAENPKDEDLLFLLGFAYLKSGDEAKGKALFQQMFEVAGPTKAQFLFARAYYEAGLFPQSEESFGELQKMDPQFPGLHLALGKLYISERKTDEAVRELQIVLKDEPTNNDAIYFLGSLLVQEGKYEEGVRYLERAQELKPDSWGTYFYLGKAKLRMNQTREAIGLLRKAVEIAPDEVSAQYQLARALEANGQKDAAAEIFRKAREIKAESLTDNQIPGVR